MFRWEPEGRLRHKLCTAIAHFWFSTEHPWTALTPFWLSTDESWIIRTLFCSIRWWLWSNNFKKAFIVFCNETYNQSILTTGTPEERGIKRYWQVGESVADETKKSEPRSDQRDDLEKRVSRIVNHCYDIPIGMSFLQRVTWSRHIPISPTYGHDVHVK